MKKKFATYTLIVLLTGSIVTAFSITDRVNAREQNLVQVPRSAETSPMNRGMEMRVEVDKPFIEMMIPHHQSANEMAQMALSRAKSPEVKKLAQSIISYLAPLRGNPQKANKERKMLQYLKAKY